MVQRRGGCWPLPWCSMGRIASRRRTCGMDRQTLRDWVHGYNAEGLRGLHDVKTPGPKPKLTAEQQAELARLVEAGPDPACHGVVRWRRVDLRDELERRFGVVLHERSVGKLMAKLGYRGSPCVRAIHRPTKRPRKRLKKLRRDRHGAASRARQRQGDRNLVPGRSPHRSARYVDP